MKDNKVEPETVIHRHVADAREGREPRVVGRVYSGWVLFGQQQFVRGYAVLLPDPVVPTINALGAKERSQFLMDMTKVGDALMKVSGALRVNYAMFGNAEPALHAHIVPRYLDEPEEMRAAHPWAYNWDAAPAFDRAALHDLAESLRRELGRMGVTKQMRFSPGENA